MEKKKKKKKKKKKQTTETDDNFLLVCQKAIRSLLSGRSLEELLLQLSGLGKICVTKFV